MSDPDQSTFHDSMRAIRRGNDDAIWAFIEEFGPHIERVIRRRLDERIRARYDTIDFVQMVWASFFREPERMTSFDDPRQLMVYLEKVANNKVIDVIRNQSTEKNDVERETSLKRDPDLREDTPVQIAIAKERWIRLMATQSDRNKRVVQLRLQGLSFVEIGEQLGINERTARQVIYELVESNEDVNVE